MRVSRIVGILAVLPLVAIFVTESIATDPQQVNAFYSAFLETLNKESPRLRMLSLLVKANRPAAEKCLEVITEKSRANPQDKKNFRYFRETLEMLLVATKEGTDCSAQGGPMLARLGKDDSESNENRIFLLESAERLCPDEARSFYNILGDRYMEESQFGMAEAAYENSLKFKPDDPDTKKLLQGARNRERPTKDAGAVADKEASPGVKLMAPVKTAVGGIRRKVEIRATLQTHNILFDEWSAAIKTESAYELKRVADGIKQAFKADPAFRVVIEGHTDERGPEERNVRLSQERAESVKTYLVQTEGVDASRLDTKGCGPWSPFSSTKGEDGWKQNRRVEFKKFDK